jgi:hypothetical protein
VNTYTTFFVRQSDEDSVFLSDTGVVSIPNDKYATAASEWLQVSRQGTAKPVCVSTSVFTSLEIQFHWNYCYYYFMFCLF